MSGFWRSMFILTHSILGWASFCMNDCMSAVWFGGDHPVAVLGTTPIFGRSSRLPITYFLLQRGQADNLTLVKDSRAGVAMERSQEGRLMRDPVLTNLLIKKFKTPLVWSSAGRLTCGVKKRVYTFKTQ